MTWGAAGSPLFPFFALLALVVPERRALIRSASDDLTYFETMNHAPMATAQMMTINTAKPIVRPPPLHRTDPAADEYRRSAIFRKTLGECRWPRNGRRLFRPDRDRASRIRTGPAK